MSDSRGLEPRFSDDKQWYWNGSAWIPAYEAPVVPPPPTTPPPPGPMASQPTAQGVAPADLVLGDQRWDGQRWVPTASESMAGRKAPAASAWVSSAQAPAPASAYVVPQAGSAIMSIPQKKGHLGRNIGIGCAGLIGLIVLVAIASSGANQGTQLATVGSSTSKPTPVDPATYKASAKQIPYVQLEKDPGALAATTLTYTGQVIQYDSATTTSNLRINVTPDGFGNYTDTVWLDVDPTQTTNVYRDSVIQFWGEVVGPYTYQSVLGAQITIPEVKARFVAVVKS
jgi:hypothetical protein